MIVRWSRIPSLQLCGQKQIRAIIGWQKIDIFIFYYNSYKFGQKQIRCIWRKTNSGNNSCTQFDRLVELIIKRVHFLAVNFIWGTLQM